MRRLPLVAAVCAGLLLAGCQQSVMVRPVKGVSDSPPPAARTRSYAGRVHAVQSGDTLYKISLQYGVDYRDIARWNAIDAPYTIYPRQVLRLEAEDTVASEPPPRESRRPRSTPSAPPETVRNGDGVTMTALPDLPAPAPAKVATAAPASGVSAAVLSEDPEPSVSATASVAKPEPTFIDTTPPASTSTILADPSMQHRTSTGSEDAAVLAEAPSPPPSPVSPAAPPRTTVVANLPPAAVGTPSPTLAAVKPTAASADVESARPSPAGWIWPTPGRVVVSYAGGDPTRQGIDIAGTLGQPVRVARDGEVVYSGAGLIGYGELIIVKHSPELLSAYGHNRVRLVKEGEKLKAGQKIAEMGKNAANRVLLHFEVRKGGKPIDPMPLLPAQ